MVVVARLSPARVIDVVDQGFWAIPIVGMLIGVFLGFTVPALDSGFDGAVGPFAVAELSSTRSLLEVIATVNVSVAGLSFSVTVVAVQLASQQLSPRVLKTFQRDRLNKTTLAVFLGTSVYALVVLARLGAEAHPNLSMSVGVLLTIGAFALFGVFIHNIVVSLQASTVISRIRRDARGLFAHPYPSRIGAPDRDFRPGRERRPEPNRGLPTAAVCSPDGGYLVGVHGNALIDAAQRHDGFVVQEMKLGDYALSGATIAHVHCSSDPDRLADEVKSSFILDGERSLTDDAAFPVRQLADIALRALSPGVNDPTTCENAMDALADTLIAFANATPAQPARRDDAGVTRFVAVVPDLDDLVRLGFEQVTLVASDHPVVSARLRAVLEEIERAALRTGQPRSEIERQRRRLGHCGVA
jgi:uncharacterized membrane protein